MFGQKVVMMSGQTTIQLPVPDVVEFSELLHEYLDRQKLRVVDSNRLLAQFRIYQLHRCLVPKYRHPPKLDRNGGIQDFFVCFVIRPDVAVLLDVDEKKDLVLPPCSQAQLCNHGSDDLLVVLCVLLPRIGSQKHRTLWLRYRRVSFTCHVGRQSKLLYRIPPSFRVLGGDGV